LDKLCDFGFDGLSSGRSPDRLDALVWAVTALVGGAGRGGPRITLLDWGPPSPLVPLWRR
jgi:phage terminase large subunit-like protein